MARRHEHPERAATYDLGTGTSMEEEGFTGGADYTGYNTETPGQQGKGPRGWRRRDERILEDVCDALTESPWVDASEVSVDVQDGVVILSGTVADRDQKREAERCVYDLTGVNDVQNLLRIEALKRH
jgi:osmotically-inducible protein OsmY